MAKSNPRQKTYRISVSFENRRIRKTIRGMPLSVVKEIKTAIRKDLVEGTYIDTKQKAKYDMLFLTLLLIFIYPLLPYCVFGGIKQKAGITL